MSNIKNCILKQCIPVITTVSKKTATSFIQPLQTFNTSIKTCFQRLFWQFLPNYCYIFKLHNISQSDVAAAIQLYPQTVL